MPAREIRIPGAHNVENVLAAAAAGLVAGIQAEVMAHSFRTFTGVEHRLEFVAEVAGVAFYNDSKATNVDSTRNALGAFQRPLIVIMGGKDKGGDFQSMGSLIRERARQVILIGAAAGQIAGALEGVVPLVRAGSMEEAVQRAFAAARPGDVVLLSPACASFDMFVDYEDRGRVFKQAVAELAGRTPPAPVER